MAALQDFRLYLSLSFSLCLSLSLSQSNSKLNLLSPFPVATYFLLSACCLMSAYMYIEIDLIVGSFHLFSVVVVGPFEWVSCIVHLTQTASVLIFFFPPSSSLFHMKRTYSVVVTLDITAERSSRSMAPYKINTITFSHPVFEVAKSCKFRTKSTFA